MTNNYFCANSQDNKLREGNSLGDNVHKETGHKLLTARRNLLGNCSLEFLRTG